MEGSCLINLLMANFPVAVKYQLRDKSDPFLLAGGHSQARLLHALARAQDGPQRHGGLVQGGDQRQPGHDQELLDTGHPYPRPREVEIV